MARKRDPNKPPHKRKLSQKYETHRILFEGCSDEFRHHARRVYDPDVHPAGVLAYFKEGYENVDDPIEYKTDKGIVGFVTKPVRPPSAAAYAAKIGVRPETLWAWEKSHSDFREAIAIGKAFQQAAIFELGSMGAMHTGTMALILKNLHGWTDKLESTHKGSVAFQFDADDEHV